MNTLYAFLLVLLTSLPVLAQNNATDNEHLKRRRYADYDEEILFFGKRNQYFTVRTLLKSGAVFRLDTYTLLPQTLPNGFQLDSLSRIIRNGPTKIYYPDGKVYISCEYKDNMLNGPFMVLYEDGATKRREYYRGGRLSKSECYTPDGTKQVCAPFYQAAAFQGESKELSAYLKQKLNTVIDGERVRRVSAAITINEIGQVVMVKALVNGSLAESRQMPEAVNYVQNVIRTMPEWSTDKLNWKPAMNDGIASSSTCVLWVYKLYGQLQYRLSFQL
ncbi:toxin-antitoxin system YwqK family antitoxin [Spirosoma aerophilum]